LKGITPVHPKGCTPNVGQILLAQALQCALAQKIGIALALLRELHNCLGDDFVDVVATLGNSKRYASHFERDAHDARRLAIKSDTVQERGDRHGALPPNLRRERDRLASAPTPSR